MKTLMLMVLSVLCAACYVPLRSASEGQIVSELAGHHGWIVRCDNPRPDPANENSTLCDYRRMVKITAEQRAQMDSAVAACRADPTCQAPRLPFVVDYPEVVTQMDSAGVRYMRVVQPGVVPSP